MVLPLQDARALLQRFGRSVWLLKTQGYNVVKKLRKHATRKVVPQHTLHVTHTHMHAASHHPSPVLLSQGFLPFKVFRDILDYYSVALHSSQVRQLGNSYEAPRQAHVDVEALLEDAEEFMYGAGEDGVKAARDEKERRLLAKAKLEELAAVNKVIKRLRQVGGLGVRADVPCV